MPTWRQGTPLGDVVVTLGPRGVEHISFSDAGATDTAEVGSQRRIGRTPSGLGRVVARELDEFFAGTRTAFDVAVDLSGSELSDLQRLTLEIVRAEVPYGETATYGEVAEMIGRPGAARAVGTAMARNPVQLLIPCHRVVAANGIGGYGGGRAGIALKRALLDREARARPSR